MALLSPQMSVKTRRYRVAIFPHAKPQMEHAPPEHHPTTTPRGDANCATWAQNRDKGLAERESRKRARCTLDVDLGYLESLLTKT